MPLGIDELAGLYLAQSSAKLRALARRKGSLRAFLEEETVCDPLARLQEERKDFFQKDLEFLERTSSVEVVTYWDEDFPELLREIPDPPLVLFCMGARKDLLGSPSLAVVGTRRPSHYGRVMAERVGRALAGAGWTVVSGGAYGIDSVVHRAVLEAGGGAVVVLGSGLAKLYPAGNKRLFREVMEQGLLVSEYLPFTSPAKYTFPQRNRIVSGLSSAVIVVEAGERSGALITARLAVEQGRDVYAFPGPVDSVTSLGCNRLISQGAIPVLSVDWLVEELGLQGGQSAPKNTIEGEGEDLARMRICELIRERGRVALEEVLICLKDIPKPELLAYISLLEIEGAIRRDGQMIWLN